MNARDNRQISICLLSREFVTKIYISLPTPNAVGSINHSQYLQRRSRGPAIQISILTCPWKNSGTNSNSLASHKVVVKHGSEINEL